MKPGDKANMTDLRTGQVTPVVIEEVDGDKAVVRKLVGRPMRYRVSTGFLRVTEEAPE